MKAQTFLPEDYRPAEDEPFMNERHLEYFRRKLIAWKQELLDQSAETLEGLQDSARNVPDLADRASEETDRSLELRTRDRQRKLVSKIDSALRPEGKAGALVRSLASHRAYYEKWAKNWEFQAMLKAGGKANGTTWPATTVASPTEKSGWPQPAPRPAHRK